jgi:enamine deaminase RidA (YjgF/YER057c/UK114 family)
MIERFGSGGPYEDVIGYSRVVRAGALFVTAGCTATVDGEVVGVGDAYQQALTAFGIALGALERAGAPAASVIRSRMYVTDRADADAVGRAHHELLGAVRPAATMVIVAGLINPQLLVEVELDALARPATAEPA